MQHRLESKFAENMKYYGTEKTPKFFETANGVVPTSEQVKQVMNCQWTGKLLDRMASHD